jgi:hypothetical protein
VHSPSRVGTLPAEFVPVPPRRHLARALARRLCSGERWVWAHASYEEGLLLLMSSSALPAGAAPAAPLLHCKWR